MNPNARLLVVDDDTVLPRSTSHALRGAGYQVEEASTAEECLRLAEASHPDLILLEVVLPDGCGVEVCRKLKSNAATSGIFVVLISGFQTSSGCKVAGLEAGADAYVVRPVEGRELVARIQSLLRLQQAQALLEQARQELEQRVAERTAELSSANQQLKEEIAERRQLEARYLRAQKLEAVGQLAAGLAHDFNNILTIIVCNTSMLCSDTRIPADLRRHLDSIAMGADRAAGLTRRLLLFSRHQVIQPRLLDLNGLIERLGHLLRSALGEHIALQFHFAANLPQISADPDMIEQTILNLSVNARDAMPNGGTLLLETGTRVRLPSDATDISGAPPGTYVCLTVADTGCGMDAATRERIFEAFFTTKEVGKGTGLGLATVHGIVTRHRGWIDVASEVGTGSTFRIYLPAAHGELPNPLDANGPATLRPGTETILLVEDEPVVRDLARTILKRQGYQVLTAVSGLAALELWGNRERKIDLLLTDMVMPDGVSGWELAARLTADQPGLKVILTSGYGMEAARRDFVLPEAYDFLQKPFDPDRLARAVRSCLDR